MPSDRDDAPNADDLKRSTLAGIRWVAYGRGASEVLHLVSTVALARLIAPEQFGLAAVALITRTVAQALAGQGFGSPLVQRPTIERVHIQAASAMALLSGAALTVLTAIVGLQWADAAFGDGAGRLMVMVAPLFLLAGIGVVPQALLQRRLDFKRTSAIEVASLLVSVVLSVGLAVAGLEGEAIVLGSLAAVATSSLLLAAAVPVPRPRLDRAAARELLGFGGPAAGASLLYTVLRSADRAVIAAALGPAAAGFYFRAYQLGLEYQTKVSGIMQRIAFPVYSRTESLAQLRRMRLRIVRLHATVLFPLLGLLIALAPEGIPLVFGSPWEPAVEPARYLAVCGMVAVVLTGTGSLLMAVGRPGALLVYNGFAAGGFLVAVAVAAPHGLEAVCVAFVAFQVVNLIGASLMTQRLVAIPARGLVTEIGPAAVGTLVLIAGALSATAAVHRLDGGDVPALLLGLALGSGAYVVVVRGMFPAAWGDVQLVLEQFRRRRRRSGNRALAPSSA